MRRTAAELAIQKSGRSDVTMGGAWHAKAQVETWERRPSSVVSLSRNGCGDRAGSGAVTQGVAGALTQGVAGVMPQECAEEEFGERIMGREV
jgi:hypothetical protein